MCTILSCWFSLILISSIYLIYWWSIRTFNYWSKRGINGPKPYPLVGNQFEHIFNPNVELEWMIKFGKVYGRFNKMRPSLIVADPDLIKDILVKDFHLFTNRQKGERLHPILGKHLVSVGGEDWKRIRYMSSPIFSLGKIKRMYPMIKRCLNDFLEALDDKAIEGQDVNLMDVYGKYTMDVIATCAFATKTNSHRDPQNPFIKNVDIIFNPKMHRLFYWMLLPRQILKLFRFTGPADESANQFFFDLTRHIIKERKNSKKKYNDFIDLLLEAEKNANNDKNDVSDAKKIKDEKDSHEAHHLIEGQDEFESERKALSGVSDKYLTEDEILAQAWGFFTAGYEPTATTLALASYELALNPQIQQRLYEEVSTAVDSKGDIDYDDLSELEYLDAVISETLRMHCSIMRLTRAANEDYKLGNTGITITKEMTVGIPIYALHHSEEYFDQPFKFKPDRFLPENRSKIIPYTYLPFGAGARSCIGMRFGLIEAKIALAQVIRMFRLLPTPQTDIPLVVKPSIIHHGSKRVFVGIEKRVI